MSEDQNAVNPYQTPQADITDISVADGDAELAGRGTRLGAYLIDLALIIIAIIPILIFMDATDDSNFGIAVGITLIALMILLIINLIFLIQNSQSIGKKMVGVKIVRTDGEHCGLARIIFLRNVVIGMLGNIPLVGPFISLADPLFIFRGDRRCIHDLIADTKVIVA